MFFESEVRNISWQSLYQCTEVNEAVDIFTSNLTIILHKMAPEKTFQTCANFAPWLSEDTKKMMWDRDRVLTRVKTAKNEDDWSSFKKLKNKVNKRLQNEKHLWQKSKLEGCLNKPGDIWKHIKGWLNFSSTSSPTRLFSDGCNSDIS